MGVKQQLYSDFLKKEGYVPEILAGGDVQFKYQGETFVITADEEDPNYFKLSYYHAWEPTSTAKVWPLLNELNAKFKVVKVSVLNNVICLTTETLLKDPADFEPLFTRCLHIVNTGKTQLAAALARASQPAPSAN